MRILRYIDMRILRYIDIAKHEWDKGRAGSVYFASTGGPSLRDCVLPYTYKAGLIRFQCLATIQDENIPPSLRGAKSRLAEALTS
jgi:hypothetical protein